ncbi:glycosyltransferase 87 family protein [Phytomonospora sp. NPDC050363]|uniref:glycosyltransferase 87 family protein n=1 Tax=Phytomonospora sp. NPDC050363 TaxID=3155642 RepID=UPI0033F3A827
MAVVEAKRDGDSAAPERPRRPRWLLPAQITGAAALVALTWYLVSTYGGHHRLFDLRIYRKAVRYWLAGGNVYDYWQEDVINGTLGYTYPPFASILMAPMGALPWDMAKWTHICAMVVCLAITTYWLVTPLLRRHKIPLWLGLVVAGCFIVSVEPIRETLSFGQVNLMLIALVLGDVLFLVRRKSSLAGIGIGLATAIKLTPGIFIVYLLVTRRWRAAAGSIVTAAAVSLLAVLVDPRMSIRFWLITAWDSGRVGHNDNTSNQSIAGLLARIFDPAAYPQWLWIALVALVVVYGMWKAAKAVRAGDEIAGLTITGIVGILMSPVSWTHHIYWIVPALLIILDVMRTDRRRMSRRRLWSYGGLALFAYLPFMYGFVWLFAEEPGKHWDHGFAWFLAENTYVFALVALLLWMPVRKGVDDTDSRPGVWWPIPWKSGEPEKSAAAPPAQPVASV